MVADCSGLLVFCRGWKTSSRRQPESNQEPFHHRPNSPRIESWFAYWYGVRGTASSIPLLVWRGELKTLDVGLESEIDQKRKHHRVRVRWHHNLPKRELNRTQTYAIHEQAVEITGVGVRTWFTFGLSHHNSILRFGGPWVIEAVIQTQICAPYIQILSHATINNNANPALYMTNPQMWSPKTIYMFQFELLFMQIPYAENYPFLCPYNPYVSHP